MDQNSLTSKLNDLLGAAVLETRMFGRSAVLSVWVEAQAVPKVAGLLKADPDLQLNWLENLSAVELEEVVMVTYFLRSTVTSFSLVLRVSAVLPSAPSAHVQLPSVREVWPMCVPMEQEVEEMFGIRFLPKTDGNAEEGNYLPKDWDGFPLRKNYVFPKNFLGINHSRPFRPKADRTSS